MKIIPQLCAAALLASTSHAALAASPDARIQAMENQIQALSKQIQELKDSTQQQQDAVKAQQEAVKLQQAEVKSQQADFKKAQSTAAKPGIANGRLSVSSSDGNYTAAIRALLQFDTGYYMQQSSIPTSYGPDLSSGANLRRVFLGLQGKVFGDFSYYFLYDFGGPSTETQGHIIYAYLQYDGLAPWAFRVGAYAPPLGIEDSTTSADLMFFERNSPSNLQRGIAGAEGRDAISVLYTGERIFGALSLTGNKIQDGGKALQVGSTAPAANYDEQIAVLGRLSYLPVSMDDAHWIVNVNGLHVFKLPDLVANGGTTLSTTVGSPAKSSYSFGDGPEFTVDSNGVQLVTTGALPAGHVTSWGLETAGNYQNFYGQAGYFAYNLSRSPVAYTVFSASGTSAPSIVRPSSNDFSGWYLQASWIMTGESRVYNPATASFTAPKVAKPLSLKDGGWGAFEVVARFSDLNLNSHTNDATAVTTNWTSSARTYTFYNTVRGGEQKIFTVGLNWYLNSVVRTSLDYQYIDVSHLQPPSANVTALPVLNVGQTLSTIALRVQLSL